MPTFIDCVGPEGQTARMTERQLDRLYRDRGWRRADDLPDPPEPTSSTDLDESVDDQGA